MGIEVSFCYLEKDKDDLFFSHTTLTLFLQYCFSTVPQNLIKAIVDSNNTRKEHIANMIISNKPKIVGIYRLTMKKESDNYRESSVLDVINILNKNDIEIVIYEPTYLNRKYNEFMIINDIDEFIYKSDIIIANRLDKIITNSNKKIYSRDVFFRD